MAKTRSKVKSSDEDGSPKSAQKKVKLLQSYVACLISLNFFFKAGLSYPFLTCNAFSPSTEGNSTAPLTILEMCTRPMYWTCQWTPMNPLTACVTRSLMAR